MKTKRENPWSSKRAPARTAGRSTTQTAKASSTPRPKSIAALRRAKAATAAPSPSASVTPPSWLRVGSSVKLSWEYDRAYGEGHASFVGKVVMLDDWIKVVSSNGVNCYMPLSMVKVERVR